MRWDDISPGLFWYLCGNLSVKTDVIWLDTLLPWFCSAFSCPSDLKVNEVQRTCHLCLHVCICLPTWYASKMMQNWNLSMEEPLVKENRRRGAWQNYNRADKIIMPVLQISLPFLKQPVGVFGFWVWKGYLTPFTNQPRWLADMNDPWASFQ